MKDSNVSGGARQKTTRHSNRTSSSGEHEMLPLSVAVASGKRSAPVARSSGINVRSVYDNIPQSDPDQNIVEDGTRVRSLYDNISLSDSYRGIVEDGEGGDVTPTVEFATNVDETNDSVALGTDVHSYGYDSDLDQRFMHSVRLDAEDPSVSANKYALSRDDVAEAINFAVSSAYVGYLEKSASTNEDIQECKRLRGLLGDGPAGFIGRLRDVSTFVNDTYNRFAGSPVASEDSWGLASEISNRLLDKVSESLGIDKIVTCILWSQLAKDMASKRLVESVDPLNELYASVLGAPGDPFTVYADYILQDVGVSFDGHQDDWPTLARDPEFVKQFLGDAVEDILGNKEVDLDSLLASKNPYIAILAGFVRSMSKDLPVDEREGAFLATTEKLVQARSDLSKIARTRVTEEVMKKVLGDRSKVNVVLDYISDPVISGLLTIGFAGSSLAGAFTRISEERNDVPWVMAMSRGTTGLSLSVLLAQMFAVAKNSWDKSGETFKAMHGVIDSLETVPALRELKHRMVDAIQQDNKQAFLSNFGLYSVSASARFMVNVAFNAINSMHDPRAMLGASIFITNVVMAPSTFCEFRTVQRFAELVKKTGLSVDLITSGCDEFTKMCMEEGIDICQLSQGIIDQPDNKQVKNLVRKLSSRIESNPALGVGRSRMQNIRDAAALAIAISAACANASIMVANAVEHSGFNELGYNATADANHSGSFGHNASSAIGVTETLNAPERLHASLSSAHSLAMGGIVTASQMSSLFLLGTTLPKAILNTARFTGSVGSSLMVSSYGTNPGIPDVAATMDASLTLACAIGETVIGALGANNGPSGDFTVRGLQERGLARIRQRDELVDGDGFVPSGISARERIARSSSGRSGRGF